MAFTRIKPEGIFAVWGDDEFKKLKKEEQANSYLIKKDKELVGEVKSIKPSKMYGYIFEVQPDSDTLVIVTGKTQLLNELGFKRIKESDDAWEDGLKATAGWISTEDVVEEGETVKIIYKGKEKTSRGKPMYVFEALVDRE